MFFGMGPQTDYAVFAKRRKDLLNNITDQSSSNVGALLLLASVENSQTRFRQESSFYYLTGITDPAVALMMDFDGKTTLFVPNYAQNREAWLGGGMSQHIQEFQAVLGIDHIVELGDAVRGYTMGLWEKAECYTSLVEQTSSIIGKGGALYTLSPASTSGYVDQRVLLGRFAAWVSGFAESVHDVSQQVVRMRRKKDFVELEQLGQAIEITCVAQCAAAQKIAVEITETEIQGQVEYIMTASGAQIAFPTIVASGRNSTVIHCAPSTEEASAGDLVIVDCGAESGHYCGDITRTYPVSGKFSTRQKELYLLVLEVQSYLAKNVKPGYCISNANDPEHSLNHIAKEFMRKKGYENYMMHGVSHFLGLDVHDVGSVSEPLQEGDVITIEPGLYLPDEQLGIRIEDNYWVTKSGLICLSESLPKSPEDIEAMMRGELTCCDEDQDECKVDDDCSCCPKGH